MIALAAALPPHGGGLDLLLALALVLCVAATTTVLFQRIHQPVVLGYLLAGLIVGPHDLVPVFADVEITRLFADLGVILLMFSLGLEFSLRKLARVAPTGGIVAVVECSLMMWMGFTAARIFGWTFQECLFTGAFVAISSTTIIVKAFAERGIKGGLADSVFGILIAEDLVAIVLLAVLTAVASGTGLSAGALMITVGRLAAFLAAVLVGGLLVIPRLVRLIARLGRNETTVVASVGICFASALLARRFGYSVALGAFLGGLLVAESGEAPTIQRLIEPVRDVFAAVFFVSVGMLIDPKLFVAHWPAILALTAVVLVGKVVGVTAGAFIGGHGVPTSIKAGMSLAQIGEFSFIIVGVGVSLGVVRDFVYPIAVAISALTTLGTPWLIRFSAPAANLVDRHLPHALQTFAAIYGSWNQQMRDHAARVEGDTAQPLKAGVGTGRLGRLVAWLFIDAAFAGAVLVVASLEADRLTAVVRSALPVGVSTAKVLVAAAAVLAAAPFVVGAVRVSGVLGRTLAMRALPSALPDTGELDLAAAPRRALLVTIQLSILLVVGLPLAAITQPFLPRFPSVLVLAVGAVFLGIQVWRGATNLEGHVRAGAQVILEAVARQGQGGDPGGSPAHGPDEESAHPRPPSPSPSSQSQPLSQRPYRASDDRGHDDVRRLVPGLGDAAVVRLDASSFAVGRTLKQMNLRGRTAASAIAIERALGGGAQSPAADETLRPGDALVLTGTVAAVASARRLLTSGEPDGEF